jgi:hypothetical protein
MENVFTASDPTRWLTFLPEESFVPNTFDQKERET